MGMRGGGGEALGGTGREGEHKGKVEELVRGGSNGCIVDDDDGVGWSGKTWRWSKER